MTDGGLRRPEDAPPLVHAGVTAGVVPRHVAIIMDGNRRWARERGLDELDGHVAGTEALRGVVTRAVEVGLEHLTVYAFSRENWGRSDREIEQLLTLLVNTIERETLQLSKNGIRVDFLGRLDELPAGAAERIATACEATASGTKMRLHVAFNYAGRTEIVDAIRGIVRTGLHPLHSGNPRPRPPDPHRGGGAPFELPSLADGICRDDHGSDPLARLYGNRFRPSTARL